MKAKKKKNKTPKARLLDILTKHFAKLPVKEAQRRIEKLDKQLTAGGANDRAKRQQQAYTHLSRSLNRPH